MSEAKYRLGLVLEGGAVRGIYTAGVLDVLMKHGVQADMVIGTSAGCIHGCCYVAGQAGRSIRYYRKYRRDRHFMGFYSLLTSGEMVGRKFCYEDLPLRLDPFDEAAFEASPVDFYVTVTNVETGLAEHILCDELRVGGKMELLRAGASMPLCSRIVEYGGRKYLDGGVADSIPYRAALGLGAQRCLVVLTQPAGYLKKRRQHAAVPPGLPAVSQVCAGDGRAAERLQRAGRGGRAGGQTRRGVHDPPQPRHRHLPHGARCGRDRRAVCARPRRPPKPPGPRCSGGWNRPENPTARRGRLPAAGCLFGWVFTALPAGCRAVRGRRICTRGG